MLEELIELAIKSQDKNIEIAKNNDLDKLLHPSHYIRELKTVHLNIGRRTGKTQYIIDHATENDVVMGFNSNPIYMEGLKAAYVSSLFKHEYKIEALMGRDKKSNGWDILYIDEPAKCGYGSHDINKFIDYVHPNRVVMLGA